MKPESVAGEVRCGKQSTYRSIWCGAIYLPSVFLEHNMLTYIWTSLNVMPVLWAAFLTSSTLSFPHPLLQPRECTINVTEDDFGQVLKAFSRRQFFCSTNINLNTIASAVFPDRLPRVISAVFNLTVVEAWSHPIHCPNICPMLGQGNDGMSPGYPGLWQDT